MATALSMDPGEFSRQDTISTVPQVHVLIIECMGIGASLQQVQILAVAVIPVFVGGLSVYPVPFLGESASHNPNMVLRSFGSQQMLLYANSRVDISASRSNGWSGTH